jgi:hypothetical protein
LARALMVVDRGRKQLARAAQLVEAIAAGLAFAGLLCWLSTCLVGSFRPSGLADAYWETVPGLRTDTLGFIAFAIALLCLPVSEYLRLRRRAAGRSQVKRSEARRPEPATGAAGPVIEAIARTIALFATLVVCYLSVNAVTHPATLLIHVTHLLPWPSEGTLRVLALFLCLCSVATLRFLRSGNPADSVLPG